jgi:hypothetical protein
MLHLALALAKNCGYAVFFCRKDKSPTCPHGFKDASSDPDAIGELWRRFPGPLIGVATGAVSGISVLDIDAKHGAAVTWWEQHRPDLTPTRVYATRSGGWHLYYQHRDGVKNTSGKLCQGVDTRGDGGYVIHWFAAGLECLDHEIPQPFPEWVFALLQPPPPPPAWQPPPRTGNEPQRINGILNRLASAHEGERNAILYWAAHRLAELGMTEPQALGAIMGPARSTGLAVSEIIATVRSAFGGSK